MAVFLFHSCKEKDDDIGTGLSKKDKIINENVYVSYDTISIYERSAEIKNKYGIDLDLFVKDANFQGIVCSMNNDFSCFVNAISKMSQEEILALVNNPSLSDNFQAFYNAMDVQDYELALELIRPLSSVFKCEGEMALDDLINKESDLYAKINNNKINENYNALKSTYSVLSELSDNEVELVLSTAFEFSGMRYGNEENQSIFFVPPPPDGIITQEMMMKDPTYKSCYETAGLIFTGAMGVAAGMYTYYMAACALSTIGAPLCMMLRTAMFAYTIVQACNTYNTAITNCSLNYIVTH